MNQKQKILFVLHKLNQANFIPLGVASLVGSLESQGYPVRLICPEKDDLDKEMMSFQPDVVCYSMLTGSHGQYISTNRYLKTKYNFISIFGGAHPTFFPNIIEDEGVDIVCIGEGEVAILELLDRIGTSEFLKTENFWIKQDGAIYRNSVRSLVACLDDLPLPNYDIFYDNFPNLRANPIKHFLIGRGCPYDCTYCFNFSLSQIYKDKGARLRHKSPDYIIREIKSVLKKYSLECIYFRDDIFNSSKEWLEQFIPLYKQEVGLPFICQLRIEMINEKFIEQLITAGCVSVSLGIETGNEKLRSEVLNRHMSNEKIKSACSILKKFNLPFCINNMVGLPGETVENMFETLSLTQALRPSYSWFQIFQPYPGTRLAEYACQLNLFDGDYYRVQQSCHEKTALNFSPSHQRLVNNAHKLFALTVEWQHLTGMFKWLMTLPENILFIVLFATGQYYFTTSRLFPMLKMSTWDWMRGFWHTIFVTQPSLTKPVENPTKAQAR